MNNEMAYLLGMICGNGEIKRGASETIISIDIPHKKLETEDFHDVKLYVKASIADIRKTVEPLVDSGIDFIQNKSVTVLSFTKPNTDYLIREVLRFIGSGVDHANMKIHADVYKFTIDEKKQFLRGFADVTGYMRRSNYFINPYKHRVYLEVPHNWEMVIDICNLLKDVDVPIQSIDWAHPNMRDPKAKKHAAGQPNFWKKEHQIKIWANEFLPIGFGVLHKQGALEMYSAELIEGFKAHGVTDPQSKTHRYYWQGKEINKKKEPHPGENDLIIPAKIRGQHFNNWKQIAKELGYGK